jgi:patatin-like phospholipase/acyl hydrolase
MPKRRILCIDGGGILGTFPAAFLAGLEQHLEGRSIGSYFDLIAGTSTGGIIAIGLAMGLRASELLVVV